MKIRGLLIVVLLFACACTKPAANKNYSLTGDFFSSNIPNWTKKLSEFKGKPNVRYLELGVFEGRSFLWVLDNILTDPSARGVAVDSYPDNTEQIFKENLQESGHPEKVEVVKADFNEVLGKMKKSSFDIIYLDGGHMSWTTLETAMLAWPLLKENGILIFDDYGRNKDEWPSEVTPKAAVDSFLKTHRNFLEVLEMSFQVMVRKVPTSCRFNGTYGCTPIGKFAYYWESGKLVDTKEKKDFALSTKQQSLLAEIILSSEASLGVSGLAEKVLASKKFAGLIKEISN